MKTVILIFKMMLTKPWIVAPFLVLVMNVSRGHTLTCRPSEYQIGRECCPLCPAGHRVVKDCTEFRSTSCKPCLNETFIDRPTGRTACFPCAECNAGSGLKIKRSCTGTSDTACEPLEGFYCSDSTEDRCVAAHKHTHCLPGQYISRKGTALRDTECSDCSDGTFSDGTFFTCQPHKQCESINLQLIKAGSTSTDNECGEQSSLNIGAVIGGVVAAVVVVIPLSVIGAIIFFKKHRNQKGSPDSGNSKDNIKQITDEFNR